MCVYTYEISIMKYANRISAMEETFVHGRFSLVEFSYFFDHIFLFLSSFLFSPTSLFFVFQLWSTDLKSIFLFFIYDYLFLTKIRYVCISTKLIKPKLYVSHEGCVVIRCAYNFTRYVAERAKLIGGLTS